MQHWAAVKLAGVTVSGPPPFSITNIPSFIADDYYVSNDYNPNTGNGTWPDRCANGFNLTNPLGSGNQPTVATSDLNGSNTVAFSTAGANELQNSSASATQPNEVMILCRIPSSAAAQSIVFSGTGTRQDMGFSFTTTGYVYTYAGAGVDEPTHGVADTWIIYNYAISGGVIQLYTNGVACAAGSSGQNNNRGGFMLGGGGLGHSVAVKVAEIVLWNSKVLSSQARTDAVNDMKSRYGL